MNFPKNENFPKEAIEPTLLQLAGNIRGGTRNGGPVHVRIRQLVKEEEGISRPIILGEVIRDLREGRTLQVNTKNDDL